MLKPVVGRLCLSAAALWIAGAALAQQHTISTVAGGAPPFTPASALSVALGPVNRVATDPAGNLYISVPHAVFKMDGAGNLTRIAGNSRAGFSGDGGAAVNAQLNNPQGIAVDGAGTVYIADSNNNRVRRVSPEGIITTFAGTGETSPDSSPNTFHDGGPAISALLHSPMGLALDKSGNLLIADTGHNLVRIVDGNGVINRVAGDGYPSYSGDNPNDADDTFPAINAELHAPRDVAVDSSGNIYIADYLNGFVRKIGTDGNIIRFAGSGTLGFSGDGAEAIKAALDWPVALALDSAGNVYIAEYGGSRIRKVSTNGNIATFAGTGTPGFAGDGSQAASAQMNYPTGLALDSSGNLYVADSQNMRVRKIASGGTVSSVAGNGVYNYSGNGGPALQAQFNSPQGVAVDAGGSLYIADTGNNVVRRVAADGTVTVFAGTGTAGSAGDGNAATSAQLNRPRGLAVDSAGNVYIADPVNARVRKVSTSGAISTVAGTGTAGFGGDGGAASGAQLYNPLAVAVDSANNLYIADFGNNRIRKVAADGIITTFAGNGIAGFAGDGGPANAAQINGPQALAVDASGSLYIADSSNNRIRKVVAGAITTVAGNGLAGFSGNGGLAVRAEVAHPGGVAVDGLGNIYITDSSSRIRRVYPDGTITSAAGTGTQGYSGDGGPALSAMLSLPSALAIGPTGILYVADTGNHAVRALQYTGPGVTLTTLVNGASNIAGPVAPGQVVVLYGSNLGPQQLTQFRLNAQGLVGTDLAGTRVYFNNIAAPVIYTSAGQVGAIAPFSLSGSTAKVYMTYQGQASNTLTVPVAATAPSVFTLNGTGSGQAVAINVTGGTINGADHPAKAGSFVTLYLTGAGQTNPPGADGLPGAAPLALPNARITATVGGLPATVQYAGGALNLVAGVIQVNLEIPAGLTAGAVPVILRAGDSSTQDGVTLAVTGN